jgi:hypothetical protein
MALAPLFCNIPNGVGPVMESTIVWSNPLNPLKNHILAESNGLGHSVICTGNDTKRNTLPTKAGLKILFPNPPKTILAIAMATKEPMMIMYHGNELGTFKANKIPVSIAEKSLMVDGFFKKNFWMNHSKKTAETVAIRSTLTAPNPKQYTATNIVGINAQQTPFIIFSTDWSP